MLLLALTLLATHPDVELPLSSLTEVQREAGIGTVRLKVRDLNDEQLRVARQRLEDELEEGDFQRKAVGLSLAGGTSIVAGALVAGFGAMLAFVPYWHSDLPFAMIVGGFAGIIGGNVMLAIGLTKAGTRGSYLERIEELDAQLKARSAARESAPPPGKGPKRYAPVFRFTVLEF